MRRPGPTPIASIAREPVDPDVGHGQQPAVARRGHVRWRRRVPGRRPIARRRSVARRRCVAGLLRILLRGITGLLRRITRLLLVLLGRIARLLRLLLGVLGRIARLLLGITRLLRILLRRLLLRRVLRLRVGVGVSLLRRRRVLREGDARHQRGAEQRSEAEKTEPIRGHLSWLRGEGRGLLFGDRWRCYTRFRAAGRTSEPRPEFTADALALWAARVARSERARARSEPPDEQRGSEHGPEHTARDQRDAPALGRCRVLALVRAARRRRSCGRRS